MVPVTEDIYLYGFTNFLADIGGYLGLLLGASILSISKDLYEYWKIKKIS